MILKPQAERATGKRPVLGVTSVQDGGVCELIRGVDPGRLFVSVNGSDDELAVVRDGVREKKEALATVVGTIEYKALADSDVTIDFTLLVFREGRTRTSSPGLTTPEATVPQ